MSLSAQQAKENLKTAWTKLIEERGPLPHRTAAEILGTTEAELTEARSGENIKRLTGDYGGILKEAQGLGQIMTLVRNDYFVTMPVGKFESIDIEGARGHASGGPIDIEFDLSGWGSAYSIVEKSHGSLRRNIQFFDETGESAIKIVVWSKDADKKFDRLVKRFEDPAAAPLEVKNSENEGWLSFEEEDDSTSISDNLSPRLQALFQVCADEKVDIELRVPTRTSAETYRGPIRAVEPRDEDGNWIDLRYPHFTSHFFVGQVSRAVLSGDKGHHALTIVDKDDRIACIAKIPIGRSAAVDAAWSRSVADTWNGS